MKALKKVISLLIAVILTASLFACGASGNSDKTQAPQDQTTKSGESNEANEADAPTITFVMPDAGAVTENLPKVIDAMNKILVPKVGAKIDIKMYSFGEYSQRLTTMLTEPGSVDIFYVSGGPATYVDKDQLYDITELFANANPEFKSLFKDAYVEANKVDGKLYSLTSIINFSNEFCMRTNRELYESLGYEIDDEKVWTLDEVFELARKCKEKYPNVYPMVPQTGSVLVQNVNWDSLGDSYNIGVVSDYGSTGKVVSITEDPAFINLAKKAHEAYEEGLIMQDYLSNTEGWSTLVSSGKALMAFDSGSAANGLVTDTSKTISLTLSDNMSAANCAVRLGFGVCSTSKNPEKAFAVMQELYANPEINNLLTWGIEGENYKTVLGADGKTVHATLPDGVALENNTYTVGFVASWITPNGMYDAYLNESSPDDYATKMKEYDANAKISGCMGCVFDSTKVSDAYSSCITVYEKYHAAILGGAWNVDDYLEEYAKALKDAGEDEIIAAKQAQLDETLGK